MQLPALKLPTYAELYERIACRGVVGRHWLNLRQPGA